MVAFFCVFFLRFFCFFLLFSLLSLLFFCFFSALFALFAFHAKGEWLMGMAATITPNLARLTSFITKSSCYSSGSA